MKTQYLSYLLLFLPVYGRSQTSGSHTVMFWAGYYNTIKLSQRWSVSSDAQLRTRDYFDKWYQYALRAGGNYAMGKKFTAGAGLAHFALAKYTGKEVHFYKEWRPFQELAFTLKNEKHTILQKVRIEERFLQQVNNSSATNYSFSLRARYRLEWQAPLIGKKVSYVIGDECMVNPLSLGSRYFLDQNRTFAGLNFKVSPHLTFQPQYMKAFQQKKTVLPLENQDVFRLNLIQSFNLHPDHASR